MMDKDQNFYFLEMNTRLQVEHPVTEECTGVDLVRDMILVAAGNRLPYRQEDVEFRGAAIECRIYAEDPENNFMPSPGVITVREAPEGRNVRLDSAAYAGFEVSLHYDPMIAKLCCWGRNRDSAISNMARALREYKILGIKTTIPFHQRVLKNAAFLKGEYDTTFIDTRFDKEDLKRRQNTDPTVAVIAAALKHYEEEKEAASRATTLPVVGDSLWKYYGKLQMTAITIKLRMLMTTILATYYAKIQDVPDSEYKVEILEDGPVKKVAVNGKVYDVDYNVGGDSIYSIIINHHSHGVQISPTSHSSYTIMNKGELYQIELKGELEKIHNARSGADAVGRQVVVAPMPGVILKTYVRKGDEVKKGDPLCVLVAMKMENEIRSVADGVVKEIFVEENTKVGLNDRIMVVE